MPVKPDENKPHPKDGQIDATKTTHEGYLEKVVTVCKADWCVIKVEGLTCTGTIGQRDMGARYRFYGKLIYSARYNSWQFKFDRFEQIADSSQRGVTNYLVNQLGLTVKRAATLFQEFGAQTLEVVENSPDKIAGRLGITPEKAQEIAKRQQAVRSTTSLRTKLYSLGLSEYIIGLLVKNFGERAEQELKNRCFQLTRLHGIGFKKACDIADKIGIPHDHPERIKAGILYAITTKQQMEGHCCLERQDLVDEAFNLLRVNVDLINKHIDEMLKSFLLASDTTDIEALKQHRLKFKKQEAAERRQMENAARQTDDNPSLEEMEAMKELKPRTGVKL